MEKRLPLAILLSLLFFWVYTSTSRPPEPPPGRAAPPAAGGVPEAGRAGERAGARPPTAEGAVPVTSEAPPAAAPLVGEAFASEWTSRGAALSWLRLLDYTTSPDSDEPLLLVSDVGGEQGNVLTRDVGDRYDLDDRHWHLAEETAEGGRRVLRFHLETADGLRFERRIALAGEPHSVDLSFTVSNVGAERSGTLSLVLESARGLVDEEAGSVYYGKPAAVAVIDRPGDEHEVVLWKGGELADGDPRAIGERERVLAAGTMTNYFASLLVPSQGTDVRQVVPRAVVDHHKLARAVAAERPATDDEAERLSARMAGEFRTAAGLELGLLVRRLEPGESQSFDFRLYTGPKSLEAAAQPGMGFLRPVIESDYGWGAWINRTLLQVLRFFHRVVGNWGVAIILLTVLVKGLLFPINRRQQVSMQRYAAVMQRLKPQLDELKAKYKNNVKKFNEEQMKLLREHGATPPLGGCLLMFLQFPIWISLFQILGTSIELRQAGFVGWIDDLSRPDRMPFGLFGLETINLLPLLMAAATIVQMRFATKTADPNQVQMQRIMGIFMPLMMLWFLYGYSSGLSLYILTSSLLGIFEYQVIRRIWPVPGAPGGPPPPADEREARGRKPKLAT